MRLYQQLVLFMLAATVLPLALVGFWLLSRSEAELVSRIGQQQAAHAQAVADVAGARLLDAVDRVARAAELLPWEEMSGEELRGALSLLYQQSELVSAVLLTQADGTQRGEAVYQSAGGSGHPAFTPAALSALRQALPVQALLEGFKGQAAVSAPYAAENARGSALALAVKLGEGAQSPFALAELNLASLGALLSERAGASSAVIDLVDEQGSIVASSLAPRVRTVAGEEVLALLRKETPKQSTHFVSAALLPERLGMWAVVTVGRSEALAPVHAMRRTVLFAIGGSLGVLLLLGGLFTRRVNRRIGAVVSGAEAFGRGELGLRLPVTGADEISELSRSFNTMGAELEAARARLLGFNDELKSKVEEATAELRAAQAQLVEAQKLAAVGQLGAGVAHEINNPLAGILGHTQLMMMERGEEDPDFDALKKIEQSARRVKEITQNLLRFSQQRDQPHLRPTELNAVLREALSMMENQARGEGIEVLCELGEGVRVHGDPGHLTQVVLALVSNARTAMRASPRRQLTLRTRVDADEGILEVEDTGKGIPDAHLSRIFEPFFTTKDVWSNVGLGLSVAYRVVSEHKGRIEVETEVDEGTLVRIRLPLRGGAK